MIPYSRQNISQKDIDAVVTVLKSDYLTQGEAVPQFEKSLSRYCSAKYAVATCNATAALHVACLGLGVDSNATVWIAATSFVASANCARYCGAKVDFVDCDPETGLISTKDLHDKLVNSAKNKSLPQVLIVVHLGGQSVDMQAISSLCRDFNIRIIEDACHALGGSYQDQSIGSCIYSDCAIFSFHPLKPITSAEGGMVVTNDRFLAEKIRIYANHGIVRDQTRLKNPNKGPWYYEQQILGFNYRLSDVHAALGHSQLAGIDDARRYREKLACNYDQLFAGTEIIPVRKQRQVKSAWHLYSVLFESNELRNAAFSRLREHGVGVNVHYEPIPAQPYYQALGFDTFAFPGSTAYATKTLSLPLHALVQADLQAHIVELCLV